MITKTRLLSGLKEMVYVEEGLVTVLANFSKAVIAVSKEIPEEKKSEMIKILSKLYKDSTRHKEKMDEIIDKVEKSLINEY